MHYRFVGFPCSVCIDEEIFSLLVYGYSGFAVFVALSVRRVLDLSQSDVAHITIPPGRMLRPVLACFFCWLRLRPAFRLGE